MDARIKSLSDGKQAVCLLAATVDSLRDMSREISNLRKRMSQQPEIPKPKENGNAMADGMLRWMLRKTGDKQIEEMDTGQLGIRARKAILRSGFTLRSQLTREALLEIKDCGETTVAEILEWVEG